MNKKIYYILLIIVVCLGIPLKFSTSFEKIPIGCDEFGYLNMAKAMDDGNTFTNHTQRPYLNLLLDTLRKSGITENEISWMITPHAYHVLSSTNRIINQYPPATSFILSIIPIRFRQLSFPLVVTFLLITIICLSVYPTLKKPFNTFDLLLPFILFLMMVSPPFTTEFSRINSLAPTFGLLIAGGLLLKRHPLVATLCIALTLNFRIANVLVVLPILTFLPFKNVFSSQHLKYNSLTFLKYAGIISLAALPLLTYNYLLTGNPFAATYSAIDTALQNEHGIIDNICFYFDLNQWWLLTHLTIITLLAIFVFTKQLQILVFVRLISFAILNYFFFLVHAVKMDYYPYASAMILLGYFLGISTEIEIGKRLQVVAKIIFITFVILILSVGAAKYFKKEHITYEESKLQYTSLCNYDIVWADLYSGTSEYVCNNNGFRYGTTTPRARKLTIKFLKDNNYSQAILLNDAIVDPIIIINEINEINLKYHIIEDSKIGKILIID